MKIVIAAILLITLTACSSLHFASVDANGSPAHGVASVISTPAALGDGTVVLRRIF